MTFYKQIFLLILVFNFNAVLADEFENAFDDFGAGSAMQTLPKADLIEFFWYGCPHCYRMEATLKEAGLHGKVYRVPAVLRGSWLLTAKFYYSLKAMGVVDEFHSTVFDDIHKANFSLDNIEDIHKFLLRHNLDKAVFMQHFNDKNVDKIARDSIQLTRKYSSNGVPAFVVHGRYVTDTDIAGGAKETMNVLKHLLNKKP